MSNIINENASYCICVVPNVTYLILGWEWRPASSGQLWTEWRYHDDQLTAIRKVDGLSLNVELGDLLEWYSGGRKALCRYFSGKSRDWYSFKALGFNWSVWDESLFSRYLSYTNNLPEAGKTGKTAICSAIQIFITSVLLGVYWGYFSKAQCATKVSLLPRQRLILQPIPKNQSDSSYACTACIRIYTMSTEETSEGTRQIRR